MCLAQQKASQFLPQQPCKRKLLLQKFIAVRTHYYSVCHILPWGDRGSYLSIAEGVRVGALLSQYATLEFLRPVAKQRGRRRRQG
jgi:hypothetical protein